MEELKPKNYFRNTNLSTKNKLISYFQQIIYLNGYGNIEYEPLSNFLQVDFEYRQLFQYFYSATKLYSEDVEEKIQAMNFFRDRSYDAFLRKFLPFLKPEIPVFSILITQPSLTLESLLFLRDFSSIGNLQLFSENIFYLHLGTLLNEPITMCENKKAIM